MAVAAESFAHTLTMQSGIGLAAEQITFCGTSGYAVTELDRKDAHVVAVAVLVACGGDPESGEVTVRIIKPGTWRGHDGYAVRVEIDQ